MFYELFIGGIIAVTTFSLTIAVPLYILVLIAIITHRNVEPFNSGFFIIFFALGIVDVICYLLYVTKKVFFLGYVPEFFLPYNKTNELASYYYYPFWIFGILQYELSFFLSFNRLISVVFPSFYNKYWTTSTTYLIILICSMNATIITLPSLSADCQISLYTAEFDGLNRTFQSGPTTTTVATAKYLGRVWSIHVYGLLISSTVFYGIMLYVLRRKKIGGNKRKLEMQMFFVGFMIFALNFIFTTYFFLRDYVLVYFSVNPHVHEWILMFISDIYDLPNGLMLWFTSASVRKIIIKSLRKRMKCGSFDVFVWFKSANTIEEFNKNHSPPTITAIPKHSFVIVH